MVQESVQTIEKSTIIGPVPEKKGRLFFIDHLRAALVILVVLHHLAVVYGGIPAFYYWEPADNDPLAGLLLLVFVLFNQAWFMGALFLLAGYFTPGSYDRKGPRPFLKDRLVRLGLPLVFFYFVLAPLSTIGYFVMPASQTGVTVPLSWQVYPYILGMGPMWFVAMLLIFSFGYAGWRRLAGRGAPAVKRDSSLPGYLAIGLFIVALALASYLLRFFIPLGRTVLDFPTLAYLPQYASFFVLGAIAARRDWIQTLPGSLGKTGFAAAVVATITLFSIALASILAAIESGVEILPPFGYGTWQSAVYALWDSIFAVGMVLAALTFFRRFFAEQGAFGRFLSRHSYAVYIVHSPIVVFVAVALRDVDLGNLLKFGITVVIVVPASFAVAYLVRKIPLVSRII